MGKIKFYHKIIILLTLAVIVYAMWQLETGCLVQKVFHIPCPTCGMTRAFFALINGNVALSFELHPMLLSLPMLIIMFLFSEKLFNGKLKYVSIIMLIIVIIGFVVNYFSIL